MRLISVAVVLCAATALADRVPTGAPRRVLRERAVDAPQMLFIEPGRHDDSEVALIGVSGDVLPGDEYDLIDDGGFAAHVRIVQVTRTDDRCAGFFYQRARARVVETHHDIEAARAVAIGPAAWPRRAAQLLPADDLRVPGAAPAGAGPTLLHAVDLDGDRVPDLARYLFQCSAGHDVPWSGQGPACFEDWTRSSRGWRRSARVEFACD